MKNQSAFSLLEVLVAVMILSIITTTIWITFSNSVDAQNRSRSEDERLAEVRSAIDRMTTEINMAFLSLNLSADLRTKTYFVGKHLNQFDRLDFASFSHLKIMRDAAESDQNELSYYVEKNGDEFTLYRREDPIIDADYDKGGVIYPMLEGILEFNLRYFDPASGEWVTDWDSNQLGQKDRLPAQVEIRVVFKDFRDNPDVLQTQTLIYMTDAIQ